MKKTKLLISLLMVLALAVPMYCVQTYASSQNPTSEERMAGTAKYVAILVTSNCLTKGSLGKLTCEGETEVQLGYIAGIKIELQQQNGSSWTTIKTWEGSSTAPARRIYLANDWYVVKGTYQLKLTHTSYNSSGQLLETVYKYSKTVTVN